MRDNLDQIKLTLDQLSNPSHIQSQATAYKKLQFIAHCLELSSGLQSIIRTDISDTVCQRDIFEQLESPTKALVDFIKELDPDNPVKNSPGNIGESLTLEGNFSEAFYYFVAALNEANNENSPSIDVLSVVKLEAVELCCVSKIAVIHNTEFDTERSRTDLAGIVKLIPAEIAKISFAICALDLPLVTHDTSVSLVSRLYDEMRDSVINVTELLAETFRLSQHKFPIDMAKKLWCAANRCLVQGESLHHGRSLDLRTKAAIHKDFIRFANGSKLLLQQI